METTVVSLITRAYPSFHGGWIDDWFILRFLAGMLAFSLGCLVVYFSFTVPNTRLERQVPNASSGYPDYAGTAPKMVEKTYDFYALNRNSTGNAELKRTPPTCTSKAILPVWKNLTRDKEFRERTMYLDERTDCADMLEIRYVDLNDDGEKEVLLRGISVSLCGGVGNCAFWIFGKKRQDYKILLSMSDYIDITKMGRQVKKNRTNGYNDILLKGHMNAADTDYTTYKFDGRRYRQAWTLIHAHIPGTSDKPKWRFVTESEYARMQ